MKIKKYLIACIITLSLSHILASLAHAAKITYESDVVTVDMNDGDLSIEDVSRHLKTICMQVQHPLLIIFTNIAPVYAPNIESLIHSGLDGFKLNDNKEANINLMSNDPNYQYLFSSFSQMLAEVEQERLVRMSFRDAREMSYEEKYSIMEEVYDTLVAKGIIPMPFEFLEEGSDYEDYESSMHSYFNSFSISDESEQI